MVQKSYALLTRPSAHARVVRRFSGFASLLAIAVLLALCTCGDSSGGSGVGASDGSSGVNSNDGGSGVNSNDCVFECDSLYLQQQCVDGTQLRYCQLLASCESYPGHWFTTTCEAICDFAAYIVVDATELIFDHCGTEHTTMIDGDGSCYCRDPHSGLLWRANPFGADPV